MPNRELLRELAYKHCLRDRYLIALLGNISYRCNNTNDKRYKDYGGRGIKCFLTLQDLQILYERDRPDLMVRPSIDRKENDLCYELANCRFVELIDNIKRAKRHEYSCEQCGKIAPPRKVNNRKLCEPCAIKEQFSSFRYPRYVRKVIDYAEQRGIEVEGARIGKCLKPLSTRLLLNRATANIHLTTKPIRTTPNGPWYWKFAISDAADFYILVASRHGRYRFWICPHDLGVKRKCGVYIPLKTSRGRYSSKTDWSLYENAWHLLGQRRLDQEAADLAANIDPYRLDLSKRQPAQGAA